MRRLVACVLLGLASACRLERIIPDSVSVGVSRGSVDGSTVLNVAGFGDLIGGGDAIQADSEYDAETFVFLLNWSIGPSPRSSARALVRMEARLARMEALLIERVARPPPGPPAER